MKTVTDHQKYMLIIKHDKANELFTNLYNAGLGYSWKEITEIAYSYALRLEAANS